MRRSVAATAVGLVIGLVGCGQPEGPRALDTVFLRTGGLLAAIKPGASAPSFRGGAAVPSPTWKTVVRSNQVRGTTRLTAVDPVSGAFRWQGEVPGDFRVKVVSHDGSLAALGPMSERSYEQGRRQTSLLIAGSRSAKPRGYGLPGNYEPEAFSKDGKSLFVIRYIPARNPTSYQVQRLDLVTGEVVGVYTPDEHLQQAMGGTARIQAASPDGLRLYTLYTLDMGNGMTHAFIHVLALDELWAHCIDLPHDFALAPERSTSIAVTPDGSQVYVVNSTAQQVAVIDAESLQVTETAPISLVSGSKTYTATAGDGDLYVATSTRVLALDRDLREVRRWQMTEAVKGLQIARDARRLYVGLRNRVAVVDPQLDGVLSLVDPPGIGNIRELGPVIRPLEYANPRLSKLTCAC